MNKNYYDILQINQNASPEIIEKAYKTLAKKYHPDLQSEENKKKSEEILKEINEAYEVLSNPEKKALYDQNLKNNNISKEAYDNLYNENQVLRNELNNIKNNNIHTNNNYYGYSDIYKDNNIKEDELRKQRILKKQAELAKKQAYYDAYVQDLKNRGYKIRYKKTWRDYLKNIASLFIATIVTIILIFLLFQIPFIKNYFTDLYYNNYIIQNLMDFIFNIFNK